MHHWPVLNGSRQTSLKWLFSMSSFFFFLAERGIGKVIREFQRKLFLCKVTTEDKKVKLRDMLLCGIWFWRGFSPKSSCYTNHSSKWRALYTNIYSFFLAYSLLSSKREERRMHNNSVLFSIGVQRKKERKHCAMIIITELPLLVLVGSLVTLFPRFLWDILWIPRLQLGWWYTYFNTFGK